MMILPFLPASNLFFPVGFVIAERVLYAPSMGFCMLIGYGWSILCERRSKKLSTFVILTILAAHATKTIIRNYDWLDEYSIFMSGLRVNDRNAKLFNNVGHALESQGRFKEALSFFNMAVQVQGDDIGAHINVGRTYNHLKMFKEAEDAYLKVKTSSYTFLGKLVDLELLITILFSGQVAFAESKAWGILPSPDCSKSPKCVRESSKSHR